MKNFLLFVLFPILLASCNNEKRSGKTTSENPVNTEPHQKIANAHGLDNFDKVEEIKFTFNVKVNDSLRTSRSWHWKTRNDEIRLTEGDISRTYKKDDNLSEEEREMDQKFINDSYWLLFPFQLIWSDPEITEENASEAPISKEKMDKLIVSYTGDGGYTPGDTYEIFYDEDFIVREWIYKSADGNRESPSTWEDYEDFNGLKIAKSHKSPDGSFELFFSDIEVR